MGSKNGATVRRANLSSDKKKRNVICEKEKLLTEKIDILKEKAKKFMKEKRIAGEVKMDDDNHGVVVFHPEYGFVVLRFTLLPRKKPKKVSLFYLNSKVGKVYSKNLSNRSIDEKLGELAL